MQVSGESEMLCGGNFVCITLGCAKGFGFQSTSKCDKQFGVFAVVRKRVPVFQLVGVRAQR